MSTHEVIFTRYKNGSRERAATYHHSADSFKEAARHANLMLAAFSGVNDGWIYEIESIRATSLLTAVKEHNGVLFVSV